MRLAQRREERVVHDLLGLCAIPEHRPEVAEEARLVTLVEAIERGDLAGPDALDKDLVGLQSAASVLQHRPGPKVRRAR